MATFERYLCWCLFYFFGGVWGLGEVVGRPSEGFGEFEVVVEEKAHLLLVLEMRYLFLRN